jgi:hypothetical protein
MKISGIMLLVLMGLTPIIIFVSLIVVPTQFKWQPPENWRAEFGTEYRNAVTALTGDTANVYVGGYIGFSLTPCSVAPCYVFLKKLSLAGMEIWTRQLGDPNNITIDQLAVGTDAVYLSGQNDTNSTGFVEKFDFNGNPVWKTNLGTNYVSMGLGVLSSGLYSTGLFLDNSGTSLVTTLALKKVDLNGNAVWTRDLMNQTNLTVTRMYLSTNGVYIAASDNPTSPNPDHGFVSRYDLSGAFVWTRLLNSPLSPVYDLSGDPSGIYLGGWYLRKYDLNGNILWTTGTIDDSSISASSAGVFLIGSSLQKYDPKSGNLVWSFPRVGGEYLIFGGEDQVLAAGALTVVGPAILASYQLSSSLIIAGINPPYSFLLLGAIAGGVVLVILTGRRRNPIPKALSRR